MKIMGEMCKDYRYHKIPTAKHVCLVCILMSINLCKNTWVYHPHQIGVKAVLSFTLNNHLFVFFVTASRVK